MPHNVREKATATGDLVEPTAGGWGGRGRGGGVRELGRSGRGVGEERE